MKFTAGGEFVSSDNGCMSYQEFFQAVHRNLVKAKCLKKGGVPDCVVLTKENYEELKHLAQLMRAWGA